MATINFAANVAVGSSPPATRLQVAGTTEDLGGAIILGLGAPGTPTVTPVGTAGTTTWGYKVTASSSVGETLASTEGTTTTGNATLNGTNYNTITWPVVDGAVQYKLYRTTVGSGGNPTSTGLIGSITTTSLNDTGLVATDTPPTRDASGFVGIGTAVPGEALEVLGANIKANQGQLKFDQVLAPGALVATPGGNGAPSGTTTFNGVYLYAYTFGSSIGETIPGPVTQVVATNNSNIGLSSILPGPSGVTSRKIYRTVRNGTQLKLLTTIAGNALAAFSDTTADSGLGANVPTTNGTYTAPPGSGFLATPSGTGGSFTGTYFYTVTFVTARGETNSAPLLEVVASGATQISLSAIPTGGANVTARNIYRSATSHTGTPSASQPVPRFVSSITSGTTFTDTTADSSLGVEAPVVNTAVISPPGAPAALPNSPTSGSFKGAYSYVMTYITAQGESTPGPLGQAFAIASTEIDLSALPLGAAGVLNRNLYRTPANGTQPQLVQTLNNSAATYIDTTPDSSLGPNAPVVNTTAGGLFVDNLSRLQLDLNGNVGVSGQLSISGGVMLGDALHDPFGWRVNNMAQAFITVGANNGAQAGTMPRNRALATSSVDSFDAAANVNANAKGFQFALFDGKRVYFLPFGTNASPSGSLLAYDVAQPFGQATSYEYADLTRVVNAEAAGFLGGCFDANGYLYFSPSVYNGGTGPNTQFLRFDTRKSLNDVTAYTTFDGTTIANPSLITTATPPSYGWVSCVYDGRYVYFTPTTQNGWGNAATSIHGVVVRYDTTLPFASGSSWTWFDLRTIDGTLVGYQSCIFDGQYVYLIPFVNSKIVRYDTTASFTASASWKNFDLNAVLPTQSQGTGFGGACLIGRYIYLVPWGGAAGPQRSYVFRFDTMDPRGQGGGFSSNAVCWKYVDLTTGVGMSTDKGYQGAWSDGIYLYLVPSYNGSGQPRLARYDTRLPFTNIGVLASDTSWAFLGLGAPASTGAAWDGQYAYLCPYGSVFSLSGAIYRIRTVTPGPTDILGAPFESSDLFRDSSGLFGLGTNKPALTGLGRLHMLADRFRLETPYTPLTSGAAGNVGEIAWDTGFIYVCTATNTWKRATLNGF